MEHKYKSLSLFDFQKQYSSYDSCYLYLENERWENGFVCPKCSHTHYCKGKRQYDRQCTKCRYICSVTSGTLFHGLRFSILKAFYIIYFISTCKQGISSTELSRKLSLRQKTCWSFKRKVMEAMSSRGNYPIKGKAEVDETVFGEQEEGVIGRKNDKKQLVVIAIERGNKHGISRMYAKKIPCSSAKELGDFMSQTIDKEAKVKADLWAGYTPLKKDFHSLEQVPSGKKGRNFPEMHRAIMMLKSWIRGMHHSVRHLQAYLNEYCYRFNRSQMKEGIFENLLNKVVNHKPVLIKNIIA